MFTKKWFHKNFFPQAYLILGAQIKAYLIWAPKIRCAQNRYTAVQKST